MSKSLKKQLKKLENDLKNCEENYRLIQLRDNLGLTLTELSENVGIPYNTLRNYEKGYRNITKGNALTLAKYFEVTMPYIMGIDEVDGKMISIPKSEYNRLKKAEEQLNNIKRLLK